MLSNREKFINRLKGVLPYADSWYEGLADSQVVAVHNRHLPLIIEEAKRRDEEEVRRRLGLEPVSPKYEQLKLF